MTNKLYRISKIGINKLLDGGAINTMQCELLGISRSFILKNKGWKELFYYISYDDMVSFKSINGVRGIKNQLKIIQYA